MKLFSSIAEIDDECINFNFFKMSNFCEIRLQCSHDFKMYSQWTYPIVTVVQLLSHLLVLSSVRYDGYLQQVMNSKLNESVNFH